jgi:NTP pyrophosphatase (non-canonical NTP hydrolase)
MKAELANAVIRAMSDWIDEGKEHLAPAHLVRIRTGKLIEELGEVEDALIGVEGSNPRKGYYGSEDDVAKELLDVAAGAMYAYFHVTGSSEPMEALSRHMVAQATRAGVAK